MTKVIKKAMYESTSTDATPFIKLGAFDVNNYKPAELAKAQENEKNYKPVRLLAGDIIEAGIAELTPSTFGDVLTLVGVQVTRNGEDAETLEEAKLGVSVDIKNKLAFSKKSVGDTIRLEYLGKHPSPKDPKKTLHKVNLS